MNGQYMVMIFRQSWLIMGRFEGFNSHGGTHGWFTMKNPIEMEDFGVPLLQETTKWYVLTRFKHKYTLEWESPK